MEKHYALIVSLIKEHRKFPGYEEILEDIVADVFKHAEIVLDTVNNEEVVQTYLNKLISTSLITVPKRLGYKTSRNNHSINNYESTAINNEELNLAFNNIEITNESTEQNLQECQEEYSHNINEVSVDKNLVDKMINGIDANDRLANIEISTQDNLIEEFSDIETSDIQEIQEEETVLEEEVPQDNLIEEFSDIETSDIQEIQEEETALEEEVPQDNLIEEFSDIETLEIQDDIEEKKPISDKNSYSCFDFEPDLKLDYADEIKQNLLNFNSKHPDKHVLDIFNLKYKENKSISDISEKLNLDFGDVLDTLNDIIYLVKD